MNRISIIVTVVLMSCGAYADCVHDGSRTQSVSLSVEGRQIDRWEITSGAVHRVRLPQGFELGLQIEPATAEKYRELFEKTKWHGISELVKITLLDLSVVPPLELSTTWGGANSKQGFGPRGGANGVPVLLDQIELWFYNPVCVTSNTIPLATK